MDPKKQRSRRLTSDDQQELTQWAQHNVERNNKQIKKLKKLIDTISGGIKTVN